MNLSNAFWRGFLKAAADVSTGETAQQVPKIQTQPAIPTFTHTSQNVSNLANSIFYAEGGTNTSHPYGVLAKYKTTTPRQATLNTINHQYNNWTNSGSHGDFLAHLQSKYAPVGANNDPQNLNSNWLKNVRSIFQGYLSGRGRVAPPQ